MPRALPLALIAFVFLSEPAVAASPLDGSALSLAWGLPFVGLLLTIAAGPLLFGKIWHAHYGKIAAAWSLMVLAPLALFHGTPAAVAAFIHALIDDYLSFIVLLFALYTIAGGILVTGRIRGTPAGNTTLLALGTLIASIVGTTGAAMILIRPLIKANRRRQYNAHVFVFFIILVANIGGALSPLGDPPLFVGFLRGVDFFWPAQNLLLQTTIVAIVVLGIFFALESAFYRREKTRLIERDERHDPIRVRGAVNLLLIMLLIAAILLSAAWKSGLGLEIHGVRVALEDALRDATLLLIALFSLWLTPNEHRAANGFTWEPMREVAKLFAAIFIAAIPVLAMLKAGRDGSFAFLLSAVTANDGEPHEAAYFWLTGLLSAFLDNAPTYLVFFELAGGDARQLMGPLAGTLAAISMGAVYMGALTYIGNAPNLMIYAIAQERGIRMPSFISYMLWACLVLLPIFLLLTLLPVAPVLKLA
jgi:Na+/H+ antiporter NhaD/arsenite permease-like protein